MTLEAKQQRFEQLLLENRRILYKVCSVYCRDASQREDLAQEIVVHLWRSFSSFDGRCRFSTWMYRIALNVAISSLRRETVRHKYELADDADLLNVADSRSTPTHGLEELYRFLDTLDPLNKALILLYLDEQPYAAIAEVLGLTETNVATKLSRLKQRMKRELTESA